MQITISARAIKRVALVIGVAVVVLLGVALVRASAEQQLPGQVASSKRDAVTLSDGSIYFGDLQPAQDGYNELRHAHRLVRNSDTKNEDQSTKVVPITQDAIQPRSSIYISSEDIVTVQPLQSKSIISKVIDKAE